MVSFRVCVGIEWICVYVFVCVRLYVRVVVKDSIGRIS